MKLLAIDGNSIINRAFYGIKVLTTKDGQYTNAVYGFITILNRLIETEKPDCAAIAFDLRKPTFRHLKYTDYKAGRKPMPQELAEQMPLLKEWLTLAGYLCVTSEGYEADDILGTLARVCEENGDQCVICTGDRDSLQLISDKTRVVLVGNRENVNYTPDTLFEKYGLTPNEMIELKALMGDSSDNIPGVAGVGEKTATALISAYHNIDYIYEHLPELDLKDSVKTKLQNGKENAFLSRELGTICKTVPISENTSDYVIRPADKTGLAKLMTKLEFFGLMEKMHITPDNSANGDNATEEKENIFSFSNSPILSDTVTLYCENGEFAGVCNKNVFLLSKEQFDDILKDSAITKRVYNLKNLYKQNSGITNVVFDGMLAAYLCNPSASSYATERLVAEYCNGPISLENGDGELLKNACRYCIACDKLEQELVSTGQAALLQEIELPLSIVLAQMELYGFEADKDGLHSMSNELETRIELIEKEIYSLVGYEFNLNSPKQLGVALFEKLGLPAKKKTKTGYSTNAEILEELKHKHLAVALLLEYRQLAKLKSTYTDGLQSCIEQDGRIRSTFNQTETRTGRISSLEPNLQNIPVRTQEGKRLRAFFTAPQGRVLCDADYSQIELRVLASMANDSTMIDAFQSGTDIHTVTASQVFGVPLEFVTPIMRSRAKAVNFGIVYGIGAFSLSKDIDVTVGEAKTYISNYLSTYKGVAQYMESVIEQARNDGYVTTLFGRRRYIPELQNSNKITAAFGERVARNAPIQGTAADIIKLAMIRVNNRLCADYPSAKLILQVHDELIVECDEADAAGVCQLLQTEMELATDLAVRLTADANFGKTWLEAKG